ncbi:MarR family winged helix-turn-helix transcriptional regulator [Planomonospora parontospora]|uniref:MarR family winged helix-turn-helix transcriptional regulator n=1 Tax=Planomonospora parontospora TaxID=58119 RepID=UPI0016712D84|nr:MarR family transcriptional regulator [Planomonospora parontospora subsp. antibiotica]GII17600.1 MarR family transcriptional regulator [Planomonospora parontospora subsp. antibiotica]
MLGRVKLLLENQLCFEVHATARALDGVYRTLLRDLGLTYPQYLAMMVLWEREPVTVKELGAALRLDSGTLSPLLKRMETAGLVRRERSAADERSVLVRLTPAGAGLRARAEEIPGMIFAATGLGLEELAALRATLRRVTAALDEAALGAAPGGER